MNYSLELSSSIGLRELIELERRKQQRSLSTDLSLGGDIFSCPRLLVGYGFAHDHDVVIIAGDICAGMVNGVRWLVDNGLNEQPVIYVAGNHEFYGLDRYDELEAGRDEAARHKNIHVLERGTVTIQGVRFVGVTLWTDYRLFGKAPTAMAVAAQALSDHKHIRNGDRLWSPADCAAEHVGSQEFIREELELDPCVVVTHHTPSLKSAAPKYRGDILRAAFGSDLEELASEATLWVHGHMHSAVDYRIGGCRVVANPRGYVGQEEDAGFRAGMVVEV